MLRLMLIVLTMTVLAGCAPAIVQPPPRFFWPPKPEQPRIEWIATYFGDTDIQAKTFMSEIIGVDSSVMFKRPISAAGDGEGRFVVTDQGLGMAALFDLNKQEVFPLGGSVGAVDFRQPTGVAVDGEGNFYVADTRFCKVFVVNRENTVLRVLDLSEHAKSIGGLAVDRARAQLVIPDAKGGKLLLFSLTGQLLSTIEGGGNFAYPNAVAVASDGSLLIADTFSATIVRLSSEGKYISSIGKRGDSPGDLALVTGVAVDSEDHIYATDGRLHNLTIFDKAGNTLLVIGGQYSMRSGNIARGGFLIPQGVSIDKNDRIYVADSFNRRVQVFQYLNKRYMADHPITEPKP